MTYNKLSMLLNKNFLMRSITTLALAPGLIWLVLQKHSILLYLNIFIAFIMITEWSLIVFRSSKNNSIKLILLFIGVSYIVFSSYAICLLNIYSNLLVVTLLLTVWTTDIGAYLAGSIIGGKKLAPTVSPNKTWSGSIGGLILSGLTSCIMSHYLLNKISPKFILLFLLFSIIGQFGDLFESAIKRYFHIKDTGNILPGHGGLLDRMDSLLLIAILILILEYTIGFSIIFKF